MLLVTCKFVTAHHYYCQYYSSMILVHVLNDDFVCTQNKQFPVERLHNCDMRLYNTLLSVLVADIDTISFTENEREQYTTNGE